MTEAKQPELPALTEDTLAGLRLYYALPRAPSDDAKLPISWEMLDALVTQASRCLSAERELAELKALGAGAESRFFEEALESNLPDGPWSDPASRLVAKGPASAWSAPRRVGRYLYRKTRVIEYAPVGMSERERDELKAKLAELERHLSECRFKLSEYGV